MTMLPSGGNSPPLSIQDINSAYGGRGNNLNSYRGTLYYKPDNSTAYLPAGAIAISDFYNTSGSSPVVPGSASYSSGSSIVLPAMFNKLYVTCYGAGGGGGQGANCVGYGSTYGGNGGSNGGATYFMSGTAFQVSAAGGGGGGGGGQGAGTWAGPTSSGAGGTGSTGSGGGGGGGGGGGSGVGSHDNGQPWPYTLYTNGGPGGYGGQGGNSGEILIMNIDVMGWSTIKAYYGATVGISIGAGGVGGTGAYSAGYSGGAGSGGWINIRWT